MNIKEIEIKNWKCFTDKTITFDDGLNLLAWPNGSGKSSLIEAIIFALFDKRPSGLDFDSLRNDLSSNCRIILKFEHAASDYVIEREFGSASSYRLYKDNELISRTRADNRAIIDKIVPESVVNALWGYNSLALSPVLKTEFLFELLESEFAMPLALKKHFQTDRTFHQKRISALEKTITNQSVTQGMIDEITSQISEIEEKLKQKAMVSDSTYIKAKQAESDFEVYQKMLAELNALQKPEYSYADFNKFLSYGSKHSAIIETFNRIANELAIEKSKAADVHPLVKYPRNVVQAMINESERTGRCVFCGDAYKPITVNYDLVNMAKIEQLEAKLKDAETYDLAKMKAASEYYRKQESIEKYKYVNDFDWKSILEQYSKETNELYIKLDQLKSTYQTLNTDLGKITDLLNFKQSYNDDKDCMNIIDEYVDLSKEYYASSLTANATDILNTINPRYSRLFIENGVYKVDVTNIDYTSHSVLAVQSLSMGEKTIVALSLILSIHKLFTGNIPLIMDEAFANLDASNVDAVNKAVHSSDIQWILVSHDERLITQ